MKTLSPKEFSAALAKHGVEKSPVTIQKWCIQGDIRADKIVGRWHIKPEEIDRLLGRK